MIALLKKEILSYFNSIMAYLVIIVFLLSMGLFLWVIPGSYNVLDYGYANLNGLFDISPFIFLFLIPAISMRLFAEEKKSGTLELLFTKPLSDIQIIAAKYFAGCFLIIISLLPTLIYYYSVYHLGMPKGNIDFGEFMGSFVGLLFLGSGFMAIGLFCSSLSDNQVISFILSVFICGFIYIGFDLISSLFELGGLQLFIKNIGIEVHYRSLSRGVIDSRDLIYFVILNLLFFSLTKLKLESRKW